MTMRVVKILGVATISLALLGVMSMSILSNEKYDDRCRPEVIALMNSIPLGETYSAVLLRLDALNLKYSTWGGDSGMPIQTGAGEKIPLEIVVYAPGEKRFGFVVRRGERIIFSFDGANKLAATKCMVVLTGP